MYKAIDCCLNADVYGTGDRAPDEHESMVDEHNGSVPFNSTSPGLEISEEEAHMAISLTEYFQEERKIYEQV